MALADYYFRYRGLTFGGKAEGIGVEFIDGLDDLAILAGDVRLPRDHGNIPGLHTINPREVRVALMITGPKRSQALADSVSSALAIFQPTDEAHPFSFKEPGMPERRINLRLIGRQRKRNPSTTHGREGVILRFTAADPRIYSEAEYSDSVPIYDGTGGGTDYDFDYDIEFTIDSSTEQIVTNNGDAATYPLLRFYGPETGTLTGVQITNTTTGQIFDLDTTLLIDQILSADMRRVVTADPEDTPYIAIGNASRWGDWQLPRDPFYLVPGDNVLRFEVTGTTTDALCVVTFRDCWL